MPKKKKHNLHIKEPKESLKYKAPPLDGNLKPIFSFEHMPYRGKFCLTKCNEAEVSRLAHHLVAMSQLNWNTIHSSGRKAYGYEHIPIEQFRVGKLPAIITQDVTNLIVFTYSHGGRMAGLQTGRIFHIIFVGEDLYEHD